MGVSKERQRELRMRDRREIWEEIISWAKAVSCSGGGGIKFTADFKSIDWYPAFAACKSEARKLTAAGYGSVAFTRPVSESDMRKSPGRRRRERSETVVRSAPFILDEKRGWVK